MNSSIALFFNYDTCISFTGLVRVDEPVEDAMPRALVTVVFALLSITPHTLNACWSRPKSPETIQRKAFEKNFREGNYASVLSVLSATNGQNPISLDKIRTLGAKKKSRIPTLPLRTLGQLNITQRWDLLPYVQARNEQELFEHHLGSNYFCQDFSDEAMNASFPTKVYTNKNCCICFEELNESLLRTPCGHVYHQECILGWITSSQASSGECPECRKPISRRQLEGISHESLHLLETET